MCMGGSSFCLLSVWSRGYGLKMNRVAYIYLLAVLDSEIASGHLKACVGQDF